MKIFKKIFQTPNHWRIPLIEVSAYYKKEIESKLSDQKYIGFSSLGIQLELYASLFKLITKKYPV